MTIQFSKVCMHALFVLGVAAVSPLWSQTNTLPTSGSVGIGTLSPVSPLQVVGPSSGITNATFGASGSGVFDILGYDGGTSLDADLSSNVYFNGSNWTLRNTSYDGWMVALNAGAGSQFGVYHVTGANGLSPFLNIWSNGDVDMGGPVGIGTSAPCAGGSLPANCKLSVAGGIQAYEVVVSNNWSDYVFDPGYRLAPLSEVAAYVKENHHLPDIPSAEEVQRKGVSLGDMQAKLLAKVEELTLHMIESEERSDRLERENAELRRQAGEILKRMEALHSGPEAVGPGSK